MKNRRGYDPEESGKKRKGMEMLNGQERRCFQGESTEDIGDIKKNFFNRGKWGPSIKPLNLKKKRSRKKYG